MTEEIRDVITPEQLQTAGLRPAGWYLFTVKSHKKNFVPAGFSERTQKAYDAFNSYEVRFQANSQAVYDDDGNFTATRPARSGYPLSVDFTNNDYGRGFLKRLYKAATEHDLTGGDIVDVLDECIGKEVWAPIFHGKRRNSDDKEEVIDRQRLRSKSYGPPASITV